MTRAASQPAQSIFMWSHYAQRHPCARVAVLPRSVRISPAPALVAGRGCTVECVVSGARPRPAVTWLLNGETYNTVEYVSVTVNKK